MCACRSKRTYWMGATAPQRCELFVNYFAVYLTGRSSFPGGVVPLFQPFFQCGSGEGREVDLWNPVFRRQDEGLGQLVTGHHLSLLLAFLQEEPGSFGGRSIVQIKDPDNGPLPNRHVLSNGQIHENDLRLQIIRSGVILSR